MKKFWFFDLDGTLADTDADIRLAWKESLKDLGLVCDDFDSKFVAGPPIEEMVKTLFPSHYTDALAQALREHFGQHYDNDGFPNTREYSGVMDRIRRIQAEGGRLFIVTNKRWVGATAMAKKFGWMTVFEGLYTGDMHKDDPSIGKLRKPELLARVISEVGAKKEDSVMVGDTWNDFEAAKANGIASIGVSWGYGTAADLLAADRVVHAPNEI